MKANKSIFALFLLIQLGLPLCAENTDTTMAYKPIPFSTVFHKIGSGLLSPFTYNYGANAAIACLGTYGLVESGADWKWNRLAYNNNIIANAGMPSVALGGLIPITIPLSLYIYGRHKKNNKIQITGLALGQAALLGMSISSGIKVFTGRRPPEILHKTTQETDYSNDFKFGILQRGAFDGWPSGHTMTAFAMATALIELYPDNKIILIGAFTYATVIGVGVSTNIHWFSDAFAGALLGYAVGKTVGRNFRSLLNNEQKVQSFNIYPMPNGFTAIYSF